MNPDEAVQRLRSYADMRDRNSRKDDPLVEAIDVVLDLLATIVAERDHALDLLDSQD